MKALLVIYTIYGGITTQTMPSLAMCMEAIDTIKVGGDLRGTGTEIAGEVRAFCVTNTNG